MIEGRGRRTLALALAEELDIERDRAVGGSRVDELERMQELDGLGTLLAQQGADDARIGRLSEDALARHVVGDVDQHQRVKNERRRVGLLDHQLVGG